LRSQGLETGSIFDCATSLSVKTGGARHRETRLIVRS
jgi:hypothetical protein